MLADDQAKVRSALRLLLDHEPEIEVLGEAVDATGLLGPNGAGKTRRFATNAVEVDLKGELDGAPGVRRLTPHNGGDIKI